MKKVAINGFGRIGRIPAASIGNIRAFFAGNPQNAGAGTSRALPQAGGGGATAN